MKPTWQTDDGRVQLWKGDCREILPALPAGCVHMVATSPPYNLKKKWWDSGANGIHTDLAEKFENEWYDDELPEAEYQAQQQAVLSECRRLCLGSVCYNHKVRHAFKRAGRTFHPIEWTGAADLWCEIIWDRGPGPAVNCRRPTMADERVFVFGRPVAWNDTGLTSIWRLTPNREETGHPCAFPVELPKRLIECFTDPGMAVLDPFCGSGTTALACLRTGRRFLGVEKDAAYFDIAVSRVQRELASTPLFEALPDVQPELFGV